MKKRQYEYAHNRLVEYTANALLKKNYRNVMADISGFEKPAEITLNGTSKGHIPDLTAQSQQFNLFEVETSDSIFHQHTKKQWKLFAAYARDHHAIFWVVVPSGARSAAEQRLNELNIYANIWEI
jgi:hypothetical protein